MNTKKYLNEENYNLMNDKIKKVAVIILVLGVLIGALLIGIGVYKSYSLNNEISETKSVDEIKVEIDDLNEELITLKAKKNSEFKENGLTEEYYRISNEISAKQSKMINLESQIWKIENNFGEYNTNRNSIKSAPFYMFGAFIIISSCMISGSIYLMTKRREIMAYSMQQVMPIAKEGLEDIAPTVAKVGKEMIEEMAPAYGKVAKEVSKGIKEGMKDK